MCYILECVRYLGRSLSVQPDCVKGRVLCGPLFGDMHYNDLLKDLLGSMVGVGYCIPILNFNLVLHGLQCKKHSNGLINQSINRGLKQNHTWKHLFIFIAIQTKRYICTVF